MAARAGLTPRETEHGLTAFTVKGLAGASDRTPADRAAPSFSAGPPDVALLPRLQRQSDSVDQARAAVTDLVEDAALLALLTPRDVPFTRLLPAAPALAASLWSVAATLAVGLVCLLAVAVYAAMFSDSAILFTAAAIAAVTLKPQRRHRRPGRTQGKRLRPRLS